MAKITIDSFRGEAPRLTPRALPPNAAQVAINARLQSGDLESWRGMLETASLTNDAQTIYLLNDAWLSWESDVDVARGPIAGDTTYRVYLTGPDEYDQPRFTNYALATTGAQPYPVTTRPLGVPGPVSVPTLVLGVDPTSTTFSVDVLDEGDDIADGWTVSNTVASVSAAAQEGAVGTPPGSYSLLANSNAGIPAYLYRNFGIASASTVSLSFDWSYQLGAADAQMIANVMVGATGQGIQVRYDSTLARFSLALSTGWMSQGHSSLASDVISPLLAHSTWFTVVVTVVVNADGTQTVTAELFEGSGLLASVTLTNVFTLGDYVGFVHESSGSSAKTYYDNIHVQAGGSSGYTPINIATSYVYTFVNDLGEESTPSSPSSTVQRPDGVSVTITTATSIPSGISSTYGITTKRIYRAATGNTGTVFRFVAEIPLATETYEDVLTDEQLGEVLESEEFDLPPDDLRGIIALPNGVMAGFSKNQLCLSAQNRPHAWPVGNRLITDTDIVSIANIDTTVVVGTESFVYSASGNDPAAYSMSQPGAPQACVAKRSMRYLNDQVGVVFASPDGLMAMTGPTTVRNVTEGVFTRRQWQDLVPETIQAAVHDDIYFFSYGTNSSASGGMFMLDLKSSGFGLVRLDYFANAMFSDPLTDKLYLTQTDAAVPDAETVLFLFHVTGGASAEGDAAEFGAGAGLAEDQTNATWTSDNLDYVTPASSPSPKFGALSLGSTANITWSRDTTQTDPLVPDEFSTVGFSTLQIDYWVYLDSAGTTRFAAVDVGVFSYPLETLFSVAVDDDGFVLSFFSSPDEETFGESSETVPSDEWVHIRLLCVGQTVRIYLNGVQDVTAGFTTEAENPIGDAGPINLARLRFLGDGAFMDDCRASIGGSSSTANFTPPTSPWPNP
jgi:hypothetical protein